MNSKKPLEQQIEEMLDVVREDWIPRIYKGLKEEMEINPDDEELVELYEELEVLEYELDEKFPNKE